MRIRADVLLGILRWRVRRKCGETRTLHVHRTNVRFPRPLEGSRWPSLSRRHNCFFVLIWSAGVCRAPCGYNRQIWRAELARLLVRGLRLFGSVFGVHLEAFFVRLQRHVLGTCNLNIHRRHHAYKQICMMKLLHGTSGLVHRQRKSTEVYPYRKKCACLDTR